MCRLLGVTRAQCAASEEKFIEAIYRIVPSASGYRLHT